MPRDEITWGIVSTIKADEEDILRFAAHHLELGAHRLFIYLDSPESAVFSRLKAHPKVRVTSCGDKHWSKFKHRRPKKHQVRQTVNATHAYRRADVDWLAHIDVDEFLWAENRINDLLDALPSGTQCARVRPVEALAGGGDLYKAFIPPGPDRERLVDEIYPEFGAFVKGGFMSHVAGKIFARTGLEDIEFRIHNLLQNGERVVCPAELGGIDLCHQHAWSWEKWIARYPYRLASGAYRPELSPNVPRSQGGMSMHDLLSSVENTSGEPGLRAFFDELSGADPTVRERLKARGLLKYRPLDLEKKVTKHFSSNC